MSNVLDKWHKVVREKEAALLSDILDDEVVFYSPVVHAPQKGKAMTYLYLAAAQNVFLNDTFRYVREVVADNSAVLEFFVDIDGVEINGVDMIAWNDQGRIVDFKVMIRPLKAINHVHAMMNSQLGVMK